MKTIAISYITIVLVLCSAWCVNAYKLTQCDFSYPYKGEIIHVIGVIIPPISIVTCWVEFK